MPAPDSSATADSMGSLALFMDVARRIQPSNTLLGQYHRWLFIIRSFLGRRDSTDWYRTLRSSALAPFAQANPLLYKKVTRPYFTPAWSRREKMNAIADHYCFIGEKLPHAATLKSISLPGLPLLSFEGKSGGGNFKVSLLSESKFNKEGETTLELYSEKHQTRVYTVTFLIKKQSQCEWVMMIGATQGFADKEIIKDVAKTLHGLRPKAFLLYIAQEMASHWGLSGIRAISNRLHISTHWEYCLNRSRSPDLSYDEFWLESKGELRPDGFFDLPVQHVPRSQEEIKPNKRSLYSQRYAMMDEVAADLHILLQSLQAEQSSAGAKAVGYRAFGFTAKPADTELSHMRDVSTKAAG